MLGSIHFHHLARQQIQMSSNKFSKVIDDAQRYIEQQSDLFGNVMYADAVKREAATPAAQVSLEPEPWMQEKSLSGLQKEICECLKCPLGQTRTKFVFGVGNPKAKVMFVGEAPGADEDKQGEPFVGRAGQLLNKIIEAVGMKREDVYICNILKCRPPNNREPLPSEMELCTPYLSKQIELVKPQFIICLGRTSAQWLLQTQESLTALRGKFHDYHGTKLVVTYHPAALLRNPNWKRPAWDDMKMFKKSYDEING
jgi:DNA polymerase